MRRRTGALLLILAMLPASATATGGHWGSVVRIGREFRVQYLTSTGQKRNFTFVMRAGGRLEWNHPNDRTPENDRWIAIPGGLEFSVNNTYVVYTAQLTGGMLHGVAKNVKGLEWTFTCIPAGP